MSEMLTVKKFAERAGCTTQAVYKRLKSGELKKYVGTEKPITISIDALQLFNQPTTNQPKKKIRKNDRDIYIEHLEEEVRFLREQNDKLAYLLSQEQDKNRLLTAPAIEEEPVEVNEIVVKEKNGFLRRLFKGK